MRVGLAPCLTLGSWCTWSLPGAPARRRPPAHSQSQAGPSPPAAPPLAIPLLAQLCLLPCRIYVVFDGFDEAEGAWVDDSDDWSWTDGPDVKLPVPAPSPPAWSESQPAGLVDKVFLHRTDEKGQPSTFFVKWKEAVRGGPAPAPRCTPR